MNCIWEIPVTNKPTAYQAFVICAALLLFAVGPLYVGAASAAGVYDVEGDFDSDGDIDFHDMHEMSEIWLLGEDSNEPNVTLVVSDVNLTPGGGLFELPGGLCIDIPAGAVSEKTSFQIRLLEAGEVEPYLDIGQTEKSFMAGVEIVSDGIAFNLPVSITVPIDPLEDPNSLPYLFYLNRKTGTLIPDLPVSAEAIASDILLANTNPVGKYFDVDCSTGELGISNLMDFPPEDWILVMAAMNKVLEHSDCVANPCRCCRFRVRSSDSDIVEDDRCKNVSITGDIQYLDCQGQPTETWNAKHESIQIAYTIIPDGRFILCEGSLTMIVELFDLNDEPLEDQEVKVTSLRPDLLEVTSFIGNMFSLERVGKGTGVANVVIDAGCEITRTVPIRIGCEIPNVAGQWSVSGSESWWGCQDPEDDGTYPFSQSINFSQNGSTFSGSIEFAEFTEDYTHYYTENYHGELTPDCEITDRCVFKVYGSTNYTQRFYFPESEPDEPPYIITGIDTFAGSYSEGVMRLTTLGTGTSGDSCQTSGSATLTR